jgi:hypothetical protein
MRQIPLAGSGFAAGQAHGCGLAVKSLPVQAGAVVADHKNHTGAGVGRREADRPPLGLPRRPADEGRLYAVVDAVANQMHERIVQPLDDRLVQFRGSPRGFENDFLVQFRGKIAHQAI